MERMSADKAGRLILERGLIRFYTEDVDPQITMLIIDFIKFLSDYQQTGKAHHSTAPTGQRIIPFPVK